MIYILYAYLTITAVTALWVVWVRFRLVDPNNADYDTQHWLFQATFGGLLWPLIVLLSPRDLFRGKERFRKSDFPLIDFNKRYKQRLVELDTMIDSPPPCGKIVIYRHSSFIESGIEYTDVRFQAADIEAHFRGKHLPLYSELESQAVVAWIKQRDEAITEPTLVPEPINFKNMAFALIEHGFGEIQCLECNAWYPAGLAIHHRPELHAGINTETYRCPLGHYLLDNDWAHLHVRTRKT
jgi:hypothetical protein